MFLAIIVSILILGFLVLSHEFGHFIVAKKSGVKVEEFGIGYPPKIWGIKKGETIYSINAIPFGGFVRLYGEDEKDEKYLKDPRSFNAKSTISKALTVSAGVIMNLLVAVIIFYFLLPFSGFSNQQYLIFDYHFPFGEQQNFPMVSFIAKDSPAEEAGLSPKDIVLEGNGIKFKNAEQFVGFVNSNKGEGISLKIKNLDSKEIRELSIVPRINPPAGEGPIGIGLGNMAEIKYGTVLEKATVGFLHSFNLAHYSIAALGHLIKTSFEEKSVEPLSSSVVGPVGILAITKLTISAGVVAILNLVALISLALAIMNILPLPALDGGRLLFIFIEGITKKRIPLKIESKINLVGFMVLIFLLVAVTYKDILQFKGILF